MSNYKTLSELARDISGCSLIHNDRGNGCGCPGYESADEALREIEDGDRDDENITEADDAEAWDLARDAYAACGLNPAGVSAVYLGERKPGDNGHQMIYVI